MAKNLTARQRVVLAALAAGRNASFAPVQVQKLFFLLDENLEEELGGRLFDFQPYDYGPFDKAVYRELDKLEGMGLVQISSDGLIAGRRRYSLAAEGKLLGDKLLGEQSREVREYMNKVSKWVRSLSFAELVGSIYKAYPRMRVNSVFRG